MEDYEKKYKEALGRANAKIETYNHLGNASVVKSICEIFPELKESEDEKIRKELIRAFTVTADKKSHEIYGNGITYGQVLAWLEKQSTPQVRKGNEWVNIIDDACEHRYAEEYAHGEYCHQQSFRWGFQEGVDWLEKQGKKIDVIENFDTEFEKQVSHLIASAINKEHEYNQDYVKWTANALFNYAKQELEKQGEQKPTEDNCRISDCVEKVDMTEYNNGYECGKQRVLKYPEEYGLCKKYAWSEEDERNLEGIINEIEANKNNASDYDLATYDRFLSWLKSLKNRVQPQPKQEWSKEDERIFTLCAVSVKTRYNDGLLTYNEYEQASLWLKSLKERMKGECISVTDEELAQAKKDAYNDALDKIEYHSGEPTFDDGWSAAMWYLKKKNTQPQNTWKPSDEQMDALETAVSSLQSTALESLYQKLNKLM